MSGIRQIECAQNFTALNTSFFAAFLESEVAKIAFNCKEAYPYFPATGGPGTTLIYLFGIMLTGFAGTALVMRRRRKAA